MPSASSKARPSSPISWPCWVSVSRSTRPCCGCAPASRPGWRLELLPRAVDHGLDRLHDRHIVVGAAVVLQLPETGLEAFHVEQRVAALAVIIAAQPCRDLIGIRDLVEHELLAGDL